MDASETGAPLLRAGLERVMREYPAASQVALAGHPLAMLIRGDLERAVRDLVGTIYHTQGSPGLGNWAETPWVSVFEPSITVSAQRGFYVCYLFRNDGKGAYLSLNQGTTEVLAAVGGRRYLEVLSGRASGDRSLLGPAALEGLTQGDLDLPGVRPLTRGYNAGNVAATYYALETLPSATHLAQDLDRFTQLYETLIEARELVNEATGEEVPAGVQPGWEAKRYRWHRRAERNRRLAQAAKKYHGTVCQGCQFNFGAAYGSHGEGYIEAHHLVPFAELVTRPGEVILDPREDFAVVCANCHRMLHRSPGLSLDQLRALLGAAAAAGGAGHS